MGFLHTFLNKTIKEEAPTEQRTLDLTFDQCKQEHDTNRPEWWLSEEQITKNRID